MLPDLVAAMKAGAAVDKLDSYSAYYEFIKDEEANLRSKSQDETLSLPQSALFRQVAKPGAYYDLGLFP